MTITMGTSETKGTIVEIRMGMNPEDRGAIPQIRTSDGNIALFLCVVDKYKIEVPRLFLMDNT